MGPRAAQADDGNPHLVSGSQQRLVFAAAAAAVRRQPRILQRLQQKTPFSVDTPISGPTQVFNSGSVP